MPCILDGILFLLDYIWFNINKISGGGSPRVTVRGYAFSRVTNSRVEFFTMTIDTDVENTDEITLPHPFVIGEQSVITFEAETTTNDTIVSLRFSGEERRGIDA